MQLIVNKQERDLTGRHTGAGGRTTSIYLTLANNTLVNATRGVRSRKETFYPHPKFSHLSFPAVLALLSSLHPCSKLSSGIASSLPSCPPLGTFHSSLKSLSFIPTGPFSIHCDGFWPLAAAAGGGDREGQGGLIVSSNAQSIQQVVVRSLHAAPARSFPPCTVASQSLSQKD